LKNNDVTKTNRNLKFRACSVSGGYNNNTSVENVPFPRDYVELINQVSSVVSEYLISFQVLNKLAINDLCITIVCHRLMFNFIVYKTFVF